MFQVSVYHVHTYFLPFLNTFHATISSLLRDFSLYSLNLSVVENALPLIPSILHSLEKGPAKF